MTEVTANATATEATPTTDAVAPSETESPAADADPAPETKEEPTAENETEKAPAETETETKTESQDAETLAPTDAATATTNSATNTNENTNESAPPSPPRRKSTKKPDVIPTGPIITEIQDMDVLSGRGAAVNNHPGNKKFRALCFVRKAHFDVGNHAAKRRLATEIVEILQSGKDHPPSRFLKKRPSKASESPAETVTTETVTTETPKPKEAAKEDGDTPATAAPAATEEKETTAPTVAAPAAATEEKPAAPQQQQNTPQQPVTYYAMTKEQAILKAQQVMRDYKRPDRLELKMLQQQAATYVPPGATVPTIKPPRARSAPSTPLEGVVDFLNAPNPEKDELFKVNPFGVHAHDVLSGRGAYVNGHVGNARLRTLAQERKQRFDAGNYTEKRTLAQEIVMTIKALDPPGRFLKRASQGVLEVYQAQQEENAKVKQEESAKAPEEKDTKEDEDDKTKDTDAAAAAAVKEDPSSTEKSASETTDDATEGASVLLQAAATSQPPSSQQQQPQQQQQPPPALINLIDGVWEVLTDDKAIHKACQVMRDISRPDRKYRETRREERLQKKNSKRRKLLDGSAGTDGEAPNAKTPSKEGDEGLTDEGKAAAVQVVDNALLDGTSNGSSNGGNGAAAPEAASAEDDAKMETAVAIDAEITTEV